MSDTLSRLYYLAVEVKPTLPDSRLYNLLSKNWRRLIDSGITNGLASGIANYDQLKHLYELGSSNIEPTEKEFRLLLGQSIMTQLEGDVSKSTIERVKLAGSLNVYISSIGNTTTKKAFFTEPAPPLTTFNSGFKPLDTLVSENGLSTEIITFLGKPGSGKSSIALSIAGEWPKNSNVWYFEPELGQGFMLNKISKTDFSWNENCVLYSGFYGVENILKMIEQEPDDDRLIVLDSLHVVCGDGTTAESRSKYTAAYEAMLELKTKCKLIVVTTQVKRGSTADDIEAAAGSSAIERYSGVLIGITKGPPLPPEGKLNSVGLFAIKNRLGAAGKKKEFAFDYLRCKSKYTLDDPEEMLKALDETE